MGTRADFYVSKPEGLEWLGSIAWDGYDIGLVAQAETESQFRKSVSDLFAPRDDVTLPERGWPWPWNDSRLTDCAYVFVDGIGVVTRHGDSYSDSSPDDGKCRCYLSKRLLDDPPADWVFDEEYGYEKQATVDCFYTYPNMADRKNVRLDAGSGLIIAWSH